MQYIGRFAPSPTGPLHFGSLVAALASFLDAKAHNGKWLLRIEDVDIPRCQPDSPKLICEALKTHGMQWDGDVLYQSTRDSIYQSYIDKLLETQQAYYCQCTRKQIRALGGVYQGTCRNKGLTSGAIRFCNDNPVARFTDRLLGETEITDPHALEDTVLKRRDELYAYNLAVVVDDHEQGVTHIVRGEDLLDTTSAHLSLYKTFDFPAPNYAHVPLAKDANGNKLSKQNHAPAVNLENAEQNLLAACEFLGLSTKSLSNKSHIDEILSIAIIEWRKMLDLLGE